MVYTILDAYTDEPAGLGVPPYLGTYPRYIFGALKKEGHEVYYVTIDDLRLLNSQKKLQDKSKETITNKKLYNLTRQSGEIKKILEKTKTLIVNLGMQTPGTYLSAVPGTLQELSPMIKSLRCRKVLTGPAAQHGTQLIGGRTAEKLDNTMFDHADVNYLNINSFKAVEEYIPYSAEIIEQIPYPVIIEIETGKGCYRSPGCSFCTEPLKNKIQYRDQGPIINEITAFYDKGCRNFRYGKQTDFYSYKYSKPEEIEKLLKGTWDACPEIEVLHIDNCDPRIVVSRNGEAVTKLIVQYCTPGNVAAFGVETFDPAVIKANTLNCDEGMAIKATQIINKYGAERGENGMPKFLPGINILFGLKGETKETIEHNMRGLKEIYDAGLMLRRINIRQVTVFPGTAMEEVGTKFIKKNKRMYWNWRNRIRQEIDYPMLKRLVPEGTVMKKVMTEVYDGNTTFGRQIGTYPLIVGMKGRLPLGKFFDVKITKHMLRSVTGEPVI
ncbi:MAG: radical SAM protein [Nanoarchaeota archaeon]